jgi:hypothetical protein
MIPTKTVFLTVLSLFGGPVLARAQTVEMPLPSDTAVGLTVQFSCAKSSPDMSIDIDRAPAEFRNEEEVVAIFDIGAANPFSLHGFTVPLEQERQKLILDPGHATMVRDLFERWGQNGSDHDLTILAPKHSLTIKAPIAPQLISKTQTEYRQACDRL